MLTVISKKNLSDNYKINNLFDIGSQKVSIKIESQNDPSSTEMIVTTSQDLSNPTKDPKENSPNKSKKKLPIGAIAGIVVGIIVLIAIVVCIILILMKKRRGNIKNNLSNISDDESIGL